MYRLAAIRRPALARLLASCFICGAGDWLLTIALPIYVFTLTGSTLRSAATMALELATALVVGQFAGLAVDRFDRRLLLVVTDLAQALFLLPLIAVRGASDLWIVYAVSAVQSALSTVSGPAEKALIPSLAAPADLVQVNTAMSTAGELAKLVGAALGGAVLGFAGLGGVVTADAATFVIAALLLALRFPSKQSPDRPESARPSRWRRWREGFDLVRRPGELRNSFALVLINQLAQGIALALIVAFFLTDLHKGSGAVGVFRGFQVVGTIPAGVLIAVFAARMRPETLLKVSLVGATVIEFFIWNGPSFTLWFPYYLALEVLLGFPGMAGFAAFSTILQRATPAPYLGRVFSLLGAVSSVALLVSVIVGGWLGTHFDPRDVLNATVALEALTAIAAIVLFRTVRGREPIA